MKYTEFTNANMASNPFDKPTPIDVVTHALSLRTSPHMKEAMSIVDESVELSSFTEEDRLLFQTRILGGMSVKLALASYHSNAPSLYELSDGEQCHVITATAAEYAAVANSRLESDSATVESLLIPSEDMDLLPDVSNKLVRSWVFNARRSTIGKGERLKSLLSYVNILPETYPPMPYYIPPVGDNDVTLVQAFGRDSIKDKDLVTIQAKHDALGSDSAMMLYLDSIHFEPGPSNVALANEVAKQLESDHPIEQIVQWEVTYALYQQSPSLYEKYHNYIHSLWPQGGSYRTHEVKRDISRSDGRNGSIQRSRACTRGYDGARSRNFGETRHSA